MLYLGQILVSFLGTAGPPHHQLHNQFQYPIPIPIHYHTTPRGNFRTKLATILSSNDHFGEQGCLLGSGNGDEVFLWNGSNFAISRIGDCDSNDDGDDEVDDDDNEEVDDYNDDDDDDVIRSCALPSKCGYAQAFHSISLLDLFLIRSQTVDFNHHHHQILYYQDGNGKS